MTYVWGNIGPKFFEDFIINAVSAIGVRGFKPFNEVNDLRDSDWGEFELISYAWP